MNAPMTRTADRLAPGRFSDWPLALKSILGFWLFYALTVAVRVEVGYTVTSGVPLTATPESEGEGTLVLQMVAAGLGDLDLSGRMFGASVISQF